MSAERPMRTGGRTVNRSDNLAGAVEPEAVALRVAALTDAESQLVLQYLAGLSPATVDTAINAIKGLQLLHQGPR
jgi:hypothetical protein